jgi:hypothetical protein
MSAADDAAWGVDAELDPAAPGGVDETTTSSPTAGVGLDAIMLALASIGDELKRIADVLESGVVSVDVMRE